MFSSLWNFLTAPAMPRTALAISPQYLALVELQKRGGNFIPQKHGIDNLPEGIIKASFHEPNILKEPELIGHLQALSEKAGFSRKLTLSVALPEGSVRSLIATLDQTPGSRDELVQMLEWKAARAFNLKASEARLKHRRLSDETGKPRWLVSAVSEIVLSQYERIFEDLGWQAGAILPHHLGEAQWILRNELTPTEDQVLVSLNESGFVAMIVRGQEPLLIREVVCAPDEREDELFRLMTFYRDRLNPLQPLKRSLIIAEPSEQSALSQALSSALDQHPQKLIPMALGLTLESSASFHRLAAATGLASLAY